VASRSGHRTMVTAMIFHDDNGKNADNGHFVILGLIQRRHPLPKRFSSFDPTCCTCAVPFFVCVISSLQTMSLKSPSKSHFCAEVGPIILLIIAIYCYCRLLHKILFWRTLYFDPKPSQATERHHGRLFFDFRQPKAKS
jgi:hypothetical protein